MTRHFVFASACILNLCACTDLSEYRTEPGKVYRGSVIGEGDPFVEGFSADTSLDLVFDPSRSEAPGTLTSNDTACGTEPTFNATPLLTITSLEHDFLSEYSFPGAERVRNYVYVARPEAGPLRDRGATIFVSLIRGGELEVRVLSWTGTTCAVDDCAAIAGGQCDYFGVFPMRKQKL